MSLESFTDIQSNLLVKIEIDGYATLCFSDKRESYSFGGDTYTGLGRLVGVTASTSELSVAGDEVTITVSGIPDTSLTDILSSKVKGSPVSIYRALFNPTTGAALSTSPNPVGRFQGYVNNWSLQEEYNVDIRESVNTIVFTCASIVETLNNKVSGRKTNPSSMRKFFPNDASMDRVPNIENITFDFGVVKEARS